MRTKDHIWKTNQIWLLCEHSASLSPQTESHGHRQTDVGGRWGWSSCSARMTQSVCCLPAHSRSLKDSAESTSSDTPRYMSFPPTLSFLIMPSRVSSSYPVCLFSPLPVCLLLYLSPLPLPLSSLNWWLISLFCFTQCVAMSDKLRQQTTERWNVI